MLLSSTLQYTSVDSANAPFHFPPILPNIVFLYSFERKPGEVLLCIGYRTDPLHSCCIPMHGYGSCGAGSGCLDGLRQERKWHTRTSIRICCVSRCASRCVSTVLRSCLGGWSQKHALCGAAELYKSVFAKFAMMSQRPVVAVAISMRI